ncbi:50S ribosome-binding GTPase [Nocardiopsis sp. RSe5-2]|uniref:50S ribosome-binding GTPase n=1 Tax=Nocardiopsis endophytica TaxID=3018445 RepID=A0ABT4UC90_9ACTN|nr:GTPase [Nocardiopsis endophytica]MDA2814084.1 50S ribosome-binding GTPase [Nocardiopsis endophytica]
MTTHRNPAQADEEPQAPADRERPSGAGEWSGYVVPGGGTDAGWLHSGPTRSAPPEGDAWPPSRPDTGPQSAYPSLRRAVDERSGDEGADRAAEADGPEGPDTAAAGGGERGEPGEHEEHGEHGEREGDSGSYPSLRRAVDRFGEDDERDGAEEGDWPGMGASGAGDGTEAVRHVPRAPQADRAAAGRAAHAGGARERDESSDAAARADRAERDDRPEDVDAPGGDAAVRERDDDGAERRDRPSRGRHAAPRRKRPDAEEAQSAAAPDGAADGPVTGADRTDRADTERGGAPGDGDMDDPDGLAGWVGSLAEAVDSDADTRIAGRRPTGAFPAVDPVTGRPKAGKRAAEADAAKDEPEGDEPTGSSPGADAPEEGARTTADESDSVASPADDGASDLTASDHTASDHSAEGDGAADTVVAPAAAGTDDEAEHDAGAAAPAPVSAFTDDDDDYVPTTREYWEPMPETTREQLIERLDGLASVLEIGGTDLGAEEAARARHLLNHAGARLRLSAAHTVVALAGGTGSGKSSLFNALCGLEFSRVGITRPTTSTAHACVWGTEGADDLLGWLGVPPRQRHSRTSELDRDHSELSGLILMDLPDHDSVRAMHTAEADRLIGAADLLVWVLDPQKYADAAVHHRYLAEMSGYGAVTVAVLNQVDRVEPDELEELLTDLRRLLETESGVHPRVLTTSTLTGHGIRELRDLLTDTVVERRALIDRLVADLDGVAQRFEHYRGPEGPTPEGVPDADRSRLVARLMEACGVAALADSVETAYELRGARRVGWPVTRWLGRLRRDPVRLARMEFLRENEGQASTRPVEAQEAELEQAAVDTAEAVGKELPSPWPKRLRAAARGGVAGLAGRLSSAVGASLPESDDGPGWWSAVRALQYALIAVAGVGLVWAGTVLASWLGGGLTGMAVLDRPVFGGLAAAVAVAALAVGWLTGVGCRNLVGVAASKRRESVEEQAEEAIAAAATEEVVSPIEQELAEYRRFTESLEAALASKSD